MLEKFLEVEGAQELTGKEQQTILGGDTTAEAEAARKGGKIEV